MNKNVRSGVKIIRNTTFFAVFLRITPPEAIFALYFHFSFIISLFFTNFAMPIKT